MIIPKPIEGKDWYLGKKVCICVLERERQTDRQTDGERDRERESSLTIVSPLLAMINHQVV